MSNRPTLRTPLHISLLIRCCTMVDPLPEPQRSAEATVEYLAELERWGAIELDGNGWFVGTKRGKGWLRNLEQVPLPAEWPLYD